MVTDQQMSRWFVGLQQHILENETFRPLREVLPQPPDAFHDLSLARTAHLNALLKCLQRRSADLIALIVSAIKSYQRQELELPEMPVDDLDRVQRLTGQLEEFGHVALSAVLADKLAAMQDFFSDELLISGKEGQSEGRLSIEEARRSENIAYIPIRRILECPHMMEIANDPETLAVVEHYLGAAPMILVPQAWWSFAGRDEARDAQLYHIDLDDYRFCKLFIYLTDVDLDSGPHAFIERTHRLSVVDDLQAASDLSRRDFFNWYYGQLRKTDSEVDTRIGIEPKRFVGPAGSRFLVDTSGVHRGMMPKHRDRLVCQFTFGVTPILNLEFNPLGVPLDGSGLIPSFTVDRQPNAYVNGRLLIPDESGGKHSTRC